VHFDGSNTEKVSFSIGKSNMLLTSVLVTLKK